MVTRTRLTSLADAAASAEGGVTFAQLEALVGHQNREWLDGWIRAQVRAGTLLRLPTGRLVRPQHADSLRNVPPPAARPPNRPSNRPTKRERERERKAARAREREARHDYWAGLIKRWLAGERIVGDDIRAARKWWNKLGRPEL